MQLIPGDDDDLTRALKALANGKHDNVAIVLAAVAEITLLRGALAEARELLAAIEMIEDDGHYLYPKDKDTLPEHWLAKRDAISCANQPKARPNSEHEPQTIVLRRRK